MWLDLNWFIWIWLDTSWFRLLFSNTPSEILSMRIDLNIYTGVLLMKYHGVEDGCVCVMGGGGQLGKRERGNKRSKFRHSGSRTRGHVGRKLYDWRYGERERELAIDKSWINQGRLWLKAENKWRKWAHLLTNEQRYGITVVLHFCCEIVIEKSETGQIYIRAQHESTFPTLEQTGPS